MIGFIMGPQGSGKGTQADLIQKNFGFFHASMGDLLRAEKNKDTEEAVEIRRIIEEGSLVPEEITNRLAKEAIESHEKILFDGYPRNMEQAEFISTYDIKFIIVIEIGEDESVKRLGKRRICSADGKILIDGKITPEDVEECMKLGGKIITRDDDKPEAIRRRLNIYREETEPLINFFESKGVKVIRINGERPIEKVHEDIQKELKI